MNSDNSDGKTTIRLAPNPIARRSICAESIADRAGQAICAFNLGIAYTDSPRCAISTRRNTGYSKAWICVRPETPPVAASRSVSSASVALSRFDDALEKERPEEECLRFINDAAHHYQQALQLFPPTAIVERGITHNQLGDIFRRAGDIDRALQHYQQSIRYSEQAGDIFGAGQTRFNVAVALFQAERFDDARAYAEAALANFQTFGDRAAEDIQKTEQLLADIDKAEAEQRGKS